jgi:thiol-disulfide isomerase/thioredoxin
MNARPMQIAGAALLMAVGVWAGLRMHGGGAQGALKVRAGQASPPSPQDGGGDFDAPFDPAATPPKIPERLPSFALSDPGGKLTSIDTWHDKSLIINFWATWCAPCRHEIPLLKTLHSDWGSRGMEVIGIAVDHPAQVRTYAQELQIPYPILIGEQDALDVAGKLGFDSPVFPFTVFTDRRGEVVALFVGELHRPQADLILAEVENVNHNRSSLADARQSIANGLHALASPDPG